MFCPKQAALGGLSVKPLKINKHITTHSSVQCRDQFNYSQACPLELNVALGLCLELKSIENWVCFGRHPQRGQQLKDLICLLKVTPKTSLNTKFSIHGQRSTSVSAVIKSIQSIQRAKILCCAPTSLFVHVVNLDVKGINQSKLKFLSFASHPCDNVGAGDIF